MKFTTVVWDRFPIISVHAINIESLTNAVELSLLPESPRQSGLTLGRYVNKNRRFHSGAWPSSIGAQCFAVTLCP